MTNERSQLYTQSVDKISCFWYVLTILSFVFIVMVDRSVGLSLDKSSLRERSNSTAFPANPVNDHLRQGLNI